MMKIPSSKRGSALLIVLGMLSFMIVSAVAFSVYMRMSRAPSSFLRRNVSSQHLVKAALARAIEDIDDKIGNDPYPGVGPNATDHLIKYIAHDRQTFEGYGNTWNNRVFCPYAERGNTVGRSPDTRLMPNITDDSGENHQYVDFDTTAAVLTLESLGYIPAPIVNQARYWSRHTETARWRRFNYDLGRWAYVAINVSDLLDINSIHAYTNRNSGDFGRLSLASAVKNANGTPQTFDNFVKNRGGTESQVPFTSIMDFNLALKSSGPVDSPFYDWITKGGNNGFYGSSVSNQVAPLLFVTDSWYPSTNSFAKGYNPNNDHNIYLSRARDQPFKSFTASAGGMLSLASDSMPGQGEKFDEFSRYLRLAGSACLYDYLDKDSVPVSLAHPSVEQTPMIIGFTPLVSPMTFTITKDNPNKVAEGGGEPTSVGYWKEMETKYKIKLEPVEVSMNVSLLFPFKRIEAARKKSFSVQAMVRLYLGPEEGMPLRLAAEEPTLRPQPSESSWPAGNSSFANSVYTFVSNKQAVRIPDASNFDKGEEEETLIDVDFSFTGNDPTESEIVYSERQYPNATPPKTEDKKIKTFTLQPYAADGTPATWTDGSGFNKPFINNVIVPNVAVWLRVIDSTGKTVDLVPATLRDDQINSVPKYDNEFYEELGKMSGVGTPLFSFKFKDAALPTLQDDIIASPVFGGMPNGSPQSLKNVALADDYKSLYCYDPRYNFAPEDWFAIKGAYDSDAWLRDVEDKLLGKDGRDSDVFMFVSNQEYLQSIGELAFIPRVQGLVNPSDDSISGDFFNIGRYGGTLLRFADRIGFNYGSAANNGYFWRTYRSFRHGSLEADPVYNLATSDGGVILDDDGRGPRVNPYTEDGENIFMAAIGNTPYDYWAASTNKSLGTQYANNFDSNPSEALKHCFNNDSPLAKVSDKEMTGIATTMHSAMMNGGRDWLVAYNNLDWYGNGDPQFFLNANQKLTSTGINDVDRKFLYSYWRNCFGNRQQLFLVFVRAEPSVLGGAQQGGRAVALVWRDPAPPAGYANRIGRAYEKYNGQSQNDMLPPHRTRVLFYHQFE